MLVITYCNICGEFTVLLDLSKKNRYRVGHICSIGTVELEKAILQRVLVGITNAVYPCLLSDNGADVTVRFCAQ